jgi:hypothetical protein
MKHQEAPSKRNVYVVDAKNANVAGTLINVAGVRVKGETITRSKSVKDVLPDGLFGRMPVNFWA